MKSFIVFALFVAAAVAAPPGSPDGEAQILKLNVDNIGTPEGYGYGYETSNGIQAQENGQIQNLGSEDEGIAVRGSFSYTGPDNVVYTVTYVADKNGFQPSAAHIPTAA